MHAISRWKFFRSLSRIWQWDVCFIWPLSTSAGNHPPFIENRSQSRAHPYPNLIEDLEAIDPPVRSDHRTLSFAIALKAGENTILLYDFDFRRGNCEAMARKLSLVSWNLLFNQWNPFLLFSRWDVLQSCGISPVSHYDLCPNAQWLGP